MNLKTKFKTNFTQNWKANPIQNEIQTASCMRLNMCSFMVADDLSS
jgi:hypothetical protein